MATTRRKILTFKQTPLADHGKAWQLGGALNRRAEQTLWDGLVLARRDNARQLFLELSGLTRMDGTGLSLLVRLLLEAQQREIQLAAHCPDEGLARLLRRTGVAELLPLFGEAKSALAVLDCEPEEPYAAPKPAVFDASGWAPHLDPVSREETPEGDPPNVRGRRPLGPLEGFGPLVHKRYWVRLCGAEAQGAAVAKALQEKLPSLWPQDNVIRFGAEGLVPGAVGAIDLKLPGAGRLSTGVRLLHRDEGSFTLSTLEGHMAAGWITFSGYDADNCPVAEVASLARTGDPLFDVGFRLFAHHQQERFWHETLTRLADLYTVPARIETAKTVVDARVRWQVTGRLLKNAAAWTAGAAAVRGLRASLGKTGSKTDDKSGTDPGNESTKPSDTEGGRS